jgi:excinuclease UvrABC helicase subunit UvrB
MYADNMTDSMRSAIEETERRREKQIAYNTSTASTRSRCARRSPTSPTRSRARHPIHSR